MAACRDSSFGPYAKGNWPPRTKNCGAGRATSGRTSTSSSWSITTLAALVATGPTSSASLSRGLPSGPCCLASMTVSTTNGRDGGSTALTPRSATCNAILSTDWADCLASRSRTTGCISPSRLCQSPLRRDCRRREKSRRPAKTCSGSGCLTRRPGAAICNSCRGLMALCSISAAEGGTAGLGPCRRSCGRRNGRGQGTA